MSLVNVVKHFICTFAHSPFFLGNIISSGKKNNFHSSYPLSHILLRPFRTHYISTERSSLDFMESNKKHFHVFIKNCMIKNSRYKMHTANTKNCSIISMIIQYAEITWNQKLCNPIASSKIYLFWSIIVNLLNYFMVLLTLHQISLFPKI